MQSLNFLSVGEVGWGKHNKTYRFQTVFYLSRQKNSRSQWNGSEAQLSKEAVLQT